MKITNLQLNNYYLDEKVSNLDEPALRAILCTTNLNFVFAEISRLASTLLCELKASYVQQSQRYVTLDERGFHTPSELAENDRKQAQQIVKKVYQLYAEMSQKNDHTARGRPQITDYKHGIPIEDARYILPLACKTNLSIAMSGDKLIDLYKLFMDERYSVNFTEMKSILDHLLPANLAKMLTQIALANSKTQSSNKKSDEAVSAYYKPLIKQLKSQEKVVLLGEPHILKQELDLRVGLGALTSTQAKRPDQVLAEWGTEARIKAQAVTDRVLGYGHDSIAEMARTTMAMMFSLVTYHQLVRHRIPQIWREALTELVYNNQRVIVIPPTIENSAFCQQFLDIVQEIRAFRQQVADKYGVAVAANYLLNCEQLQVVVANNARSDCKMMAERTCMNAQWEIRQLALAKLKILKQLSDVLYIKALPTCVVSGKCPEGKLTCGQQLEVKHFFARF